MQNQLRILEIIRNPYTLDKASLSFLEKMTKEYPYCQSLQILWAKNLQDRNKLEFEKQVNRASAYAVDRRKFQRYISGKDKPAATLAEQELQQDSALKETLNPQTEIHTKTKDPVAEEENQSTTSELINKENTTDQVKQEPSEITQKPAPDSSAQKTSPPQDQQLSLLDIVKKRLREIQHKEKPKDTKVQKNSNGMVSEPEPVKSTETTKRDEGLTEQAKAETIKPDFIPDNSKPIGDKAEKDIAGGTNKNHSEKVNLQADPTESVHARRPAKKQDINYLIDKFLKEEPRIKARQDLPLEQEDLSAPSNNEDPKLITETLALVYVKQGKKDKALDIYEKLCLKYPEKSSYFAKKILDIKNEITT